MTYGEIKLATLRLMNVTNDALSVDQINDYENDPNLSSYMEGFNNAMDRCLQNIEQRRILTKSVDLTTLQKTKVNSWYKYNLNQLNDYFDIERIIYVGSDIITIKSKKIGSDLYTADFGLMYYHPIVARTTEWTDFNINDHTIDLPRYIVDIIPYFLKGELFRDDEPNEANESRNWYEAQMELIMSNMQDDTQDCVEDVYNAY